MPPTTTTIVVTGGSRGIGGALAVAAAGPGVHLVLVARPSSTLTTTATRVASTGATVATVPLDLRDHPGTRDAAERLAGELPDGTVLVHGAGVWPHRRELTEEGLETAFVVNHLSALRLQEPLLRAGRIARILDVSAGLLVKGRVDAERTPTGADFSAFRTYCTTKLCRTVALCDTAAAHPDLDVLALHPGVVRTGLGDRPGVLGHVARLVKRRWEDPTVCGRRLAAALAEPQRWSPRGTATWRTEERPEPWPSIVRDERTIAAVRRATGTTPAR